MAAWEMNTYFGYNEGHDPNLLCIGTLVFDYANPRTKRPHYGHCGVNNLLDEPPMATADDREECSMSLKVNKSCELGFGLGELLDLEHSRGQEVYRHVVGPTGSKVELIDGHEWADSASPQRFFEETILAEDSKARLWLETRLSVAGASKFRAWWKNKFQAPSIWLLTGVYLIDDAVAYTVSSKQSSNAASTTIPIPEPTLIAEMLGASIGARFSVGRGFELEATSRILGRRVWAAQWTRVSVKYFTIRATAAEFEPQKLGNQFGLLDVEDIGNARSNDIHMVKVGVVNAPVSREEGEPEDTGVGFDDAQWAEFEKTLDQLLEDLSDDGAESV